MTDTRVRVLEATERLLQHRGYAGTSLRDITERSGAPRGSLYHHFPGGKDEIVLEATLGGVRRVTAFLEGCFAPGRDPVDGVREYVEATAEEFEASGYRFGCPVAPLILDAPQTSALADACREALEEWTAILRRAFESAGIDGGRSLDLATLVVAGIEGGLVLARAREDTEPLRQIADELEATMREAAGGP